MATSNTHSILREHVTITSEGENVSGFVHRPADPSQRVSLVVMLHGQMASKSQPPHRLFVQLADALVGIGIAALRIDFRGRGDSDGASIDVTPQRDMADTRAALAWATAQPWVDTGRLALLGVSWGGAIAAQLAGDGAPVVAVALLGSVPGAPFGWNPPMQTIDGRQATELWGNLLGAEFYAGLPAITPLASLERAALPVLLVYGTNDETTSEEAVAAARRAFEAASVPHDVVAVEGADHVFMRHAWAQEVIAHTTRWLKHTLRT
jgi:uncharacterized protein